MPDVKVGDTVSLTVEKFDPSRDSAPRLATYEVPYTREMRVLEALDYVVEELGESLSYQWFCGVKKCGMCGVMVNGRQTLGCWEPVEPEMLVQPLAGFPVVRDLVIDRSRYFANVQSLEPWLKRKRSYAGFPESIVASDLSAAADTMHCIECMLCVSACPANGEAFMGPAPMVQLARFALDPRDEADSSVLGTRSRWNRPLRRLPAVLSRMPGRCSGLRRRHRRPEATGPPLRRRRSPVEAVEVLRPHPRHREARMPLRVDRELGGPAVAGAPCPGSRSRHRSTAGAADLRPGAVRPLVRGAHAAGP